MVQMQQTAKVLLGKMPRASADLLVSRFSKYGITLASVHNSQTCKAGCTPEVEVWAHPDDQNAITSILANEWKQTTESLGYDSALLEAVYDPSVSNAVCPACNTQFSTSLAECPECELCFIGPVTEKSAKCGTGCK